MIQQAKLLGAAVTPLAQWQVELLATTYKRVMTRSVPATMKLKALSALIDQQIYCSPVAASSPIAIDQAQADTARIAKQHGAVGMRQVVDGDIDVFAVEQILAPERDVEQVLTAELD